MPDLSVIIPARNEIWLKHTVEDILAHIKGDTEIIIGADGVWPDPPVEDHPRVHMVYHPISIGQRAITNECAKISRAKYLMKLDAHCSVDEGFDVKMMQEMKDDWTMVPIMKNLHIFDWVCKKCGDRRYQSPTPTNCPKCDNVSDFMREVVWNAKRNPQSTAYAFDPEPHFGYFRSFKKRPEAQGKITETMSLQGSCFMVTRDKYLELDLCGEEFGSWGSQGIEVALKTWLSGGRVVCNHNTWYGHLFRTQGGDFGFPWPSSGKQVDHAKKHARDLFFNNKWPGQVRNLSWLLDKFWPIPEWNEGDREEVRKADRKFFSGGKLTEDKVIVSSPSTISKGLLYYTDNRLDEGIMEACQGQIIKCANGHRIVSVSLKPMKFGENIHLPLERGHLAMAKQQLAGLEALDTEIVFFTEHDCLYPKEHFDFIPPRKDVFYYNLNWFKVRTEDGQALHFKAKQVSGLCAYRNILIDYYRNRVRMIESGEIGGRRHFEPGGRQRDAYNQLTSLGFDTWFSSVPYVDIRHGGALTRNIFDPAGYRNQVTDWTMTDEIPHWGITKNRFKEWLKDVSLQASGPRS